MLIITLEMYWIEITTDITTSASPVLTPTSTGNYTFNILVTNKYGCVTSVTISICDKDIGEVETNRNGVKSFTGKVFIYHVPQGIQRNLKRHQLV